MNSFIPLLFTGKMMVSEISQFPVLLKLRLFSAGSSKVVPVIKKQPTQAGDKRDAGSIPGLGRSPGGGYGNPLQYSCLDNSVDKPPWPATVHRVVKSQT